MSASRWGWKMFSLAPGKQFSLPTQSQNDPLDWIVMSLPSISGANPANESHLVRIPEGWFAMGSESGQDNERPVHRVWVDEFQLASCAVTNAEYARFVMATGNPPAPFCDNPDFSDPRQPVVAVSWFEAVQYCEWLSQCSGPELSLADRGRVGAGGSRRRRKSTLSLGRRSAAVIAELQDTLAERARAGRAVRAQWFRLVSTSAKMFTSGAVTGMTRIITQCHPNETRLVRSKAYVELRAADPGGIT